MKKSRRSCMRTRSVPFRYGEIIMANTLQLSPHIKYVMSKFKNKLPKEDLKRFAKEVSNSYI